MGRPTDPFLFAHTTPDVVWMSQNTNHFPPHPAITAALQEAIAAGRYHGYPYAPGLPGLAPLILQDLGLQDGWEVLLTSGGTEALYILLRALLHRGDEMLTHDPSYLIIHHFAHVAEATTADVPIYDHLQRYDVSTLHEHITDRTKLLLLIDPINPLGTGYSPQEVRAIAEVATDHDLLVIDDITYRDFADSHTLVADHAPERTLIAYSFSKNAGMAGMRTGALVAPTALMKRCRPFNTNDLSINILGQVAAKAALQTKSAWLPQVRTVTRDNQALIKAAVDRLDGLSLPVYPSQANMFVIDLAQAGLDPTALQEELLYEHRVFVRSGSYVSKSFGQRFIRTSFSIAPEGIRRFCTALPIAVEALRA